MANSAAEAAAKRKEESDQTLRPQRSYTFNVKENVKEAVVANLSELDFGQVVGKELVADVLLLSSNGDGQKAKDTFGVTDQGLLFTKVRKKKVLSEKLFSQYLFFQIPLDRETKARHSLLLGRGRGGVLHSRGSTQVK